MDKNDFSALVEQNFNFSRECQDAHFMLAKAMAAGMELQRCLSYEKCDSCGEIYRDTPGECVVAQHIENYEAIQKFQSLVEIWYEKP